MPSNAHFRKFLESLLKAQIDVLNDAVKVAVIDLDAWVSGGTYCYTVSAATNASPIQITTSAAHGLSTGDWVAIVNVGGNTAANGIWQVTVVNSTAFTLQGSTGNGSFTSGGFVIDLQRAQYLSDIPSGARVATSPALSGKSVTGGAFTATSPVTITTTPAAASEALVLYHDTGTPSTSRLSLFMGTVSGLPVTPNGGNLTLTFSGAIYSF